MITPHLGMNLYIVQGLHSSGSIVDVMIVALPFAGIMLGMVALLIMPDSVSNLRPGMPEDLLMARGRDQGCVLTMVAGHIRFADRVEDHERLQQAQVAAMASVTARAELADDAQIAGLQNALQSHYARRSKQAR